jgi:hypothetical protein
MLLGHKRAFVFEHSYRKEQQHGNFAWLLFHRSFVPGAPCCPQHRCIHYAFSRCPILLLLRAEAVTTTDSEGNEPELVWKCETLA